MTTLKAYPKFVIDGGLSEAKTYQDVTNHKFKCGPSGNHLFSVQGDQDKKFAMVIRDEENMFLPTYPNQVELREKKK